MGRKSEVIDLTKVDKTELQNGCKYSKSPNFSRRCHIVSLKNQGITFQEIADIFGITRPPVHNWCNSYLEKGITGLKTKKDQGRKFILDKTKDESIIKVTVQKERQRLENAEEILEEELDKSFSVKTLQRFKKKWLPMEASKINSKTNLCSRSLPSSQRIIDYIEKTSRIRNYQFVFWR